jgi:hypothetical protein
VQYEYIYQLQSLEPKISGSIAFAVLVDSILQSSDLCKRVHRKLVAVFQRDISSTSHPCQVPVDLLAVGKVQSPHIFLFKTNAYKY